MADDVYAFGFVVWEVRTELTTSLNNILNAMGPVFRFSLGGDRFPTEPLPQGSIRCRRDADQPDLAVLNSLIVYGG